MEYNGHICKLTVYSENLPTAIILRDLRPPLWSLQWVRSDMTDDSLNTVVRPLTGIKTIILQGTSISEQVSLPSSASDVALINASFTEEALMSVLPTNGSLEIGGSQTEF
ncbi:uncharacterized protein EV420DRAFT_1652259 [Desarmillaria tabescens]|uniref:Uncharacterized protein n=1 Tax=Armillaria tabescens TaxID=1929756 RepID=A0AA39J7X1_ARMTA|nr:uncharacterized protein EV420DRAFT_1652259 [Desarmillaria tabescens]KAK0436977.1 hypothetical protein EV420DRAFT_1652259 [Desarmillaria tabescens]